MTDHENDEPVLLDPVDDEPEMGDHPDEVTERDAAEGLALYQAIDDLDDESDGTADQGARRAASPGRDEAMRRARIIRQCLIEAGVPEVSIELQQGRPASDRWNAIRPVMVMSHHIASHPTASNPVPGLALVKNGRSDLPGPLANGTAGVDLVYRILTLGLANHPGTGGPLIVRGPLGSFTIPRDNARPYAWGTEYEGGYTDEVWDRVYTNRRTGQSMTFREFMGRCNAGLVRAIWLINGLGKTPGPIGQRDLSGYHGEHKTWAPNRKPDRRGYSTESGRAEIRRYTKTPGTTPTTENEESDDMTAKDVWNHLIKPLGKGTKPISASSMLAQAHFRSAAAVREATAAAKNSASALRQAKANREAIKAIAQTLDTDSARRVTAALGPDLDDTVVRAEDVVIEEIPEETESA